MSVSGSSFPTSEIKAEKEIKVFAVENFPLWLFSSLCETFLKFY